MSIPYKSKDELFISEDVGLNSSTLNQSMQRLLQNDKILSWSKGVKPEIWECKWYNDDSISGYSKGDAVWLNTNSKSEFIEARHDEIYQYALRNKYLRNVIQPYDNMRKDIMKTYEKILDGFESADGGLSFPPMFYLGNLTACTQIRISLKDNNKDTPDVLSSWKDFFIRDNDGIIKNFNNMIDEVEEIHISSYHMNGVSLEKFMQEDVFADKTLSNVTNKQVFQSHYIHNPISGFECVDCEEYGVNGLYKSSVTEMENVPVVCYKLKDQSDHGYYLLKDYRYIYDKIKNRSSLYYSDAAKQSYGVYYELNDDMLGYVFQKSGIPVFYFNLVQGFDDYYTVIDMLKQGDLQKFAQDNKIVIVIHTGTYVSDTQSKFKIGNVEYDNDMFSKTHDPYNSKKMYDKTMQLASFPLTVRGFPGLTYFYKDGKNLYSPQIIKFTEEQSEKLKNGEEFTMYLLSPCGDQVEYKISSDEYLNDRKLPSAQRDYFELQDFDGKILYKKISQQNGEDSTKWQYHPFSQRTHVYPDGTEVPFGINSIADVKNFINGILKIIRPITPPAPVPSNSVKRALRQMLSGFYNFDTTKVKCAIDDLSDGYSLGNFKFILTSYLETDYTTTQYENEEIDRVISGSMESKVEEKKEKTSVKFAGSKISDASSMVFQAGYTTSQLKSSTASTLNMRENVKDYFPFTARMEDIGRISSCEDYLIQDFFVGPISSVFPFDPPSEDDYDFYVTNPLSTYDEVYVQKFPELYSTEDQGVKERLKKYSEYDMVQKWLQGRSSEYVEQGGFVEIDKDTYGDEYVKVDFKEPYNYPIEQYKYYGEYDLTQGLIGCDYGYFLETTPIPKDGCQISSAPQTFRMCNDGFWLKVDKPCKMKILYHVSGFKMR